VFLSKVFGLYSISEFARCFDLSISTLRYYEEQGLVAPATRIGRVRYYDHAALCSLAYALLWHRDASLSLSDTRELMQPRPSAERNQLITRQIDDIAERIRLLEGAQSTLKHLLDCPSDDPATCPHTGKQLRDNVNAALARSPVRGQDVGSNKVTGPA
jgi:DNA-binding transcriptional MerR regulator